MVRIAAAVVIGLLALAEVSWAQGNLTVNEHPVQQESPQLGKPLPPLSGPAALSKGLLNLQKLTRELTFLKDADGKLIMENGRPKTRLDAYALVINFFATYCAPCIREIPTFNRIAEAYPNQPVRFLYVNADVDKPAEEVKQFAAEKGITVEMMFPSVSPTIKSYQIETLPRIAVADRQGVVRTVFLGFQDNLTAQVDAAIQNALKQN